MHWDSFSSASENFNLIFATIIVIYNNACRDCTLRYVLFTVQYRSQSWTALLWRVFVVRLPLKKTFFPRNPLDCGTFYGSQITYPWSLKFFEFNPESGAALTLRETSYGRYSRSQGPIGSFPSIVNMTFFSFLFILPHFHPSVLPSLFSCGIAPGEIYS